MSNYNTEHISYCWFRFKLKLLPVIWMSFLSGWWLDPEGEGVMLIDSAVTSN